MATVSTPTGWSDWWRGTCAADVWWTLAWYDTVLRYRRSVLGPLWITLSMGALLLGMGPLYSVLFQVPLDRFFPHLALGIIFWQFISAAINDSCGIFVNAAPYLKQAVFPPSLFVWRTLAKNAIQWAHHMVLFVPVAAWAGIPWSPRMLLFLPGMALVLVNLHALGISLGIVATRFRDVAQIVATSLQMMMFLTPVFWFPDALPQRAHAILYNPLAQLLDVVRLPLLGAAPAPGTWWFLAFFTCVNVAVAAALYEAKRQRIVYWV